MAADYYGLLKIRRDATQDEVKRAYRRLARELHPDVNPDPETQERFKEITQAYEVLSDTEKRRMYDMGVDPFASSASAAGSPFGAGYNPLNDLLDQFFGRGRRRRRGARAAQPGATRAQRDDQDRARAFRVLVRRDPRAHRGYGRGLPHLLGRGHRTGDSSADM